MVLIVLFEKKSYSILIIQNEHLPKFNQTVSSLLVNLYNIIVFSIKQSFACDTVFFSTFKT
jgi:hypothetical protein